MSEYIEIETELDEENPALIHFFTNLSLTNSTEPEAYFSYEAMEGGSALAQALAVFEGIVSLHIEGSDMTIERDLDMSEYALIADVSALIKDFFL